MIENENENEIKEEGEKEIFIPNSDLNEVNQARIPLCSIWWILSIICWALFLLTGYSAVIIKIIFVILNYDDSIIWSIIDLEGQFKKTFDTYLEMLMHNIPIIALFIIILIFATVQFIYFIRKSTCERDDDVYDAMMGKRTKYHFIPLFFSSCLFGAGIFININRIDEKHHSHGDLVNETFSINIIGGILSLIIYISLFIIYDKTDIKNEEFLTYLLIKKGTFSCLLILSRYSLLINIYFIIWYTVLKDLDPNSLMILLVLFFSCFLFIIVIVYPIIYGLLNIYFSMKFKDIVIGMMNILIHTGMIWESFSFYGWPEVIFQWVIFFYAIIIIVSLVFIIKIICQMKANKISEE